MDHAGGVAPPVLARRAKELPEEVQRYVMAYSIAVDLAHMERVAHTTRRAAQKAAHQRLTAAPWFRNQPPTAASTRALRSLELLEARVGPDPRRSWRDEWVDLQFAGVRRKLADEPDGQEIIARMDEMHEMNDALSAIFRDGGAHAPDQVLLEAPRRASVGWKLSRGWDRDDAEGYTLLLSSFKTILCDVYGNAKFAASARTLYGAIQGRAALEGVAPLSFVNVDGEFGLSSFDAAWGALGPDAVVGTTFVTNVPLEASASDLCLHNAGFCAPVIDFDGGHVTYELQDSDIICFESKVPDGGGYHSLVRTAETEFESQYDLPPLATITLVGIDEPGTWTAFGATPNRRLYRVTVTFL